MSIKIGIDLGTTNTLVATEQKGKIKCFKFSGSDSLKSVLFYSDEVLEIGSRAAKKGLINPKNRIKSSKTFMGDFSKKWEIENKIFTPTDVACEILKEVREKVVQKLKLDSTKEIEAVITVPAYFTSNQIDETKKAAERANLKVIRIITEPVAAAIAYGIETGKDEKLFIVDLGGGTFDVTILEANVSNNIYETIAIDGDKKLGGDDFDEVILKLFIKKIKEDTGLDLSTFKNSNLDDDHDYAVIIANLTEEAENMKIDLSENDSRDVTIPNLFNYNGKDYHFKLTMTRDNLKTASKELLDRIEIKILQCLKEKNIKPMDISRVVLVGGSCNLPFIPELTKDIFEKEAYSNLDLGTLVVSGATIVAISTDSLQTKIDVRDNISHSLGIEIQTDDGSSKFEPLLKRGDRYPITAEKQFTTVYDYQDTVQLNIYEGEDIDNIKNNEFYGGFNLENIEKAKAGVPKIKVTFDFDESRVLTVIAEDLNTGSKKIVKVKKGEHLAPKTRPVDFVLMVDTSVSMEGRAIQEAKNGCKALIDEILDLSVHRLGLIKFGYNAEILNGLTSDRKLLNQNLEKLTIDGNTNMSQAIYLGTDMVKYSSEEKVMVIITDGAPNSREGTISAAKDAKMRGIKIIAIGAGQGVDNNYLKKITTTEEDYYYISDISKLRDTFETIVSSLKKL
ncbi:MAG: Hsp70 family protein [Cetobacterium sp.]